MWDFNATILACRKIHHGDSTKKILGIRWDPRRFAMFLQFYERQTGKSKDRFFNSKDVESVNMEKFPAEM
jgi:hypothetical protein